MDTSKIIVDELERFERGYFLGLISTILQLSYTSCCEDSLWKFINSNCEGCKYGWSSQIDHTCCILLSVDEECAWNLHYDDIIETVGDNVVWDLAKTVADMIDIRIHPSWYSFISELKTFPRTSIYLSILQFECCADRSAVSLTQILQVLENGPLNINRRERTISKASKISCPEEFRRSNCL